MACTILCFNPGKQGSVPIRQKGAGFVQNRSGPGGEENIPYLCRKSNPGRAARSLVILLTELSRLNYETLRY
jgi:hypothetical protein